MANRYWVGGTGDWSDTSHWSASSGGAGGASEPTSADDVYFDANSFSAGGQSVTVDFWSDCRNLDWTGATNSPTFIIEDILDVWGTVLRLIPAMTVDITNADYLYLYNGTSSSTLEITSAGHELPGIWVLPLGANTTLSLQDDLICGDFLAMMQTLSILTNDYNLTSRASILFNLHSNIDLGTSALQAHEIDLDYYGDGESNPGSNLTASDATFIIDGLGSNLGVFYMAAAHVIGDLTIKEDTRLYIEGGQTVGTLTVDAGITVTVRVWIPGAMNIADLVAVGTMANPITFRSANADTYTLSKPSGTVDTAHLNLSKSIVTGGATWNTTNSIDGGDNSGWNFDYTTQAITDAGDIGSAQAFGDATVTAFPAPDPPPTDWEAIGKEDEKAYIYRVYDSDGKFIGIWPESEVMSELTFTQHINTPATSTVVRLARSPNTTKEVRAALTTEAGDPITTEDDYGFDVTYETNNSVGEGTDVDINLRVDVWVHYGEFDNLVTEMGDFLQTEDEDYLMATSGAPNGRRLFSGYILDYESLYGEKTGVSVTLVSNGAELSQQLVQDGSDIVVDYASDEISDTLRDVLDTNPGVMTYDINSIEDTGVSRSLNFQLNTKLEAIESIYNQSPDDYYWHASPADNLVYLKQRSATPHHTFQLGYHIKEMALRRTQEQLRNLVYFVGDDDGFGTSILKKYEDATSQSDWRIGLHRIVDRRYSVAANMQSRAEKEMARYSEPVYTTSVTISSARYDLETIQLGQMVAFSNVNNFLQDLLLQIVAIQYTPRAVTVQLGEVLETQVGKLEGLDASLQNEQYQNLPNAPS